MFNIFNRKYRKAIEEIETQIEYYRGKEDYYRASLKLTDDVSKMKFYADMIEKCIDHQVVLNAMLRNIKR